MTSEALPDRGMAMAEFHDRISQAAERLKPEEPVALLNLIKLRHVARYEASHDGPQCSGMAAFRRYMEEVAPLLNRLGAAACLDGVVELFGPDGEWDLAFVVRYPDLAAVKGLSEHPDYPAILIHRLAATEDSRLMVMRFARSEQAGLERLSGSRAPDVN